MPIVPYITKMATDVIIPEKPVNVAQRVSQSTEPEVPTEEGSDRFKLHIIGDSKITTNTGTNMIITGFDGSYQTTGFYPYQLAQDGISIEVPDDFVSISGLPSGYYIEDEYPTEDTVLPHLRGFLVELYNSDVSGDTKTVTVTSLNPPSTDNITCTGAGRSAKMSVIVPSSMTEQEYENILDNYPIDYKVNGVPVAYNQLTNFFQLDQVPSTPMPSEIVPEGYKDVSALGWELTRIFTNITQTDKRLRVTLPSESPIAYVLWDNTTSVIDLNSAQGKTSSSCFALDPESTIDIPSNGIYTMDEVRDESALMNNTSLVISSSNTVATVNISPLTEKKGTSLFYSPAVIAPPFLDVDNVNLMHKLGVVISLNGGTPKLCTANARLNLQLGGSEPIDWQVMREAFYLLLSAINVEFADEVTSLIANGILDMSDGGPDNLPDTSLPEALFCDIHNSGGFFNIDPSAYGMGFNASLQLPSLFLSGGTDWEYERTRLYYEQSQGTSPNPKNLYRKLTQPIYITLYPSHPLLSGEGVTLDFALDEGYRGQSGVKPFNIHSVLGYNLKSFGV